MAKQGGSSEHKEGSGEYAGVKSIPAPTCNGYPVQVKPKPIKVRGTGAATKGLKASSKMG